MHPNPHRNPNLDPNFSSFAAKVIAIVSCYDWVSVRVSVRASVSVRVRDFDAWGLGLLSNLMPECSG